MNFETVPGEPTATVWEGELSPRVELADNDAKGLLQRRLRPEDLKGNLPVVSIGQPEVLRSLTSVDTPGLEPLAARDFYLLRLWCSFRDFEPDVEFTRAHFQLSLLAPNNADSSLIARDMYPAEVLHKVKHDVHFALTPEVKFMEVEGRIGSFEHGFTYTELQPQIVAAGQGESSPSWTFSKTRSRRLQGGKAMHLLVAAPRGTPHGEAELELTAYVTKTGLLSLPMGLFEKRGEAPPAKLRVRLW
jgi:hypothetical protein